jgi:NADH dehydrogenase (ubiquinone) 1 alpha subcomplex subunit 12
VGTLVGEDQFGNRYFENRAYQAGALPAGLGKVSAQFQPALLTRLPRPGRHRWVLYADRHNYSARSVPREWHGWLISSSDAAPTRVAQLHPVYEVEALGTTYGAEGGPSAMALAEDIHLPKGHLRRGRKVKVCRSLHFYCK